MPDTESAVITTPCHFSTVPLLQIKTGSDGFTGAGWKPVRRSHSALL